MVQTTLFQPALFRWAVIDVFQPTTKNFALKKMWYLKIIVSRPKILNDVVFQICNLRLKPLGWTLNNNKIKADIFKFEFYLVAWTDINLLD